jgi:hypothetical protein
MHASPMRPRGYGPRKHLATRFGSSGQFRPCNKIRRPPTFKNAPPKCLGHFEVLTRPIILNLKIILSNKLSYYLEDILLGLVFIEDIFI